MTTLYCAECGGRFEPDDDHVDIEAEIVWIGDRNKREDYVFHIECWDKLTAEWHEPV